MYQTEKMSEDDQPKESILPKCLEALGNQLDCLGVVFQFVDPIECVSRLTLVCREWMEFIKHLQVDLLEIPKSHYEVNGKMYQQLINSKYFGNVRGLEMNGSDLGIVRKVVNCGKFSQLKKLVIYRCGPKRAISIATSKNMSNITDLNFKNSRILNLGACAIVQSEYMSNLTFLNLEKCKVSHHFAKALANSSFVKNLTHLNLGCGNLECEGVQYLASSPNLSNLTFLDLSRNRINEEGAFHLATSSHLTKLTSLNLCANSIEDEGLSHLCFSTNMRHLKTLDLSGNLITDEGITILANNPYLGNVKTLYLENSRGNRNFRIRDVPNLYSTSAVSLIAQSYVLRNLTDLRLLEECNTKEASKLLAEFIPGLIYLVEYYEDEEIEDDKWREEDEYHQEF